MAPDAIEATQRVGSASSQGPIVGQPVLRKEDGRLLTGSGCFVDDLQRPDALRAAIVRSSHAHAQIDVNAERARAHPGVVDVITAADIPPETPPIPIRISPLPGLERMLQPPLAREKTRYCGEPLAVVVTDSRYVAEDALDLVDVAYEPLEPVTELEQAVAADATILHEQAGTNVAGTLRTEFGDVEAAFAEADVVITKRLACQRHASIPLEPRGLLAELEAGSGRLVVWGAAKIVHINRRLLAAMLGWPEERIRLVELDVGGGFGGRGEFYPEDFLVPFCAIRTGRPVAWTEDRAESLKALNHSREQLHDVELALRADGTLLAMRDRFMMNTGAYVRTHGAVVPGMTVAMLPGPYRWCAYRCEMQQVVTNKTPAGTYRAPGRYEANFVRERMIDIAARQLARDPLDLRRQNLITPEAMPHDVGTENAGHKLTFDSGDYPLLLDKAADRFDYAAMRRWRDASPRPGRRRGLGTAYFVEKSGIGRWEYARVGVTSEGRIVVHVGSASVGQGVETVLAQICAEALGVRYEDVTVAHGDTDRVAYGVGSFGSRATALGGPAVMRASELLRERILKLAADRLEADPQDLRIEANRVFVNGSPGTGVMLAELAAAAAPDAALASGGSPGLEDEAYFEASDMSFPYGLHCAAVEVDSETGAVEIVRYAVAYDIGVAINPTLVEGQIVGGVAQGIGGALLEELAYNADGQLVAGSFMDYLLPTACEIPPVEVLVTEDAPTPLSPLGAKGAGEGGTAAAGAAIANAISDATGTEATVLPLTPERVLGLTDRAAGQTARPAKARNRRRNGRRPAE
jgi:CO/xanthine dehydrogenase Mo-binding subunit